VARVGEILYRGSRSVVTLLVSLLLFGGEHIGFWMQSQWPLSPDAIFHSLLMVLTGLFFGVSRLASRSIVVAMIVHMIGNGAVLMTQ
jgi:membrane protease YdiL (CAAX protease family)